MVTPIEPEMVLIPEGDFLMGSNCHGKNESPSHRVWIDSFAISTLPVTRRDYEHFINVSGIGIPSYWHDPRFSNPLQPIVSTTWFDAVDYCNWLCAESGKSYRLPTEAEREKASRGRMEGKEYPWGDTLPNWMDPYYKGDNIEKPDPVGQGPTNGYGLHNMGDLVHEWCADWYSAEYYSKSPKRNPTGPSVGLRRASRGGSWRHRIKVTRCSARSSIPPDRSFSDYGFRVALTIK